MVKEERNKYRFSLTPPLVLVGEEVNHERGTQVDLFCKELLEYDVLMRDLASTKIEYSIKNEVLNVAFYIIGDVECYDLFKSEKNIPIKNLCKELCKPSSFFERWKEFIVAYVIILGNSKYKYLQDYIMVIENQNDDHDLNSSFTQKDINVKGIVVHTNRKNAKIITSDGEFLNIKVKEKVLVGEEVEGKVRKGIKDYKLQLSLLSFLVILLFGAFVLNYMKVTSTILVKTTSPIIIEVNTFNRVKNIKSNTEKGKAMIEAINVLDRSLDTTLIEIIKYAKENEMLPNKGIIITVNGKGIERGDLHKTEDYIFIEQIDVNINNSGTEYKLN